MKIEARSIARQHLALTPQMAHSIHLLQLSALEFELEIDQTLADNPFLERDDECERLIALTSPFATQRDDTELWDGSEPQVHERAGLRDVEFPIHISAEASQIDAPTDDKNFDDSAPYDPVSRRDSSDDGFDLTSRMTKGTCLREYLLDQMRCCRLEPQQRVLTEVIIHALEPDGYLRIGLGELSALCSDDQQVSVAELERALQIVQRFDPIGVGARDLAECLKLQLQELAEGSGALELALQIAEKHLRQLAVPDTHRLMHTLKCTAAELAGAYQLIRACTPKPGLAFGEERTEYVVADVEVYKVRERWTARVNPAVVPKIYLNQEYAAIFNAQRADCSALATQKLQEARWFLRNVNQRFKTVLRVAQAIVDRQSRYFEYGDLAMKPLVLREIAQAVGMHESTVSRVTCNKYMMTPKGLMELKYFFCSSVQSQGNAYSSTAIRALIKQIIASENPALPLSDVKVARALEQKGVAVARRTVSKYRDALQIPSLEVRRLSLPATVN